MRTLKSRNFKPFQAEAQRLSAQMGRNFTACLLYLQQGGSCYFCDRPLSLLLGRRDTVEKAHHTIPSHGGTGKIDNLVGGCHACVEERGDRTTRQFFDSRRHRRNAQSRVKTL